MDYISIFIKVDFPWTSCYKLESGEDIINVKLYYNDEQWVKSWEIRIQGTGLFYLSRLYTCKEKALNNFFEIMRLKYVSYTSLQDIGFSGGF